MTHFCRDLEENRSWLHDKNGKVTSKIPSGSIKQEIINLSIKTGIISSHTAFVAGMYIGIPQSFFSLIEFRQLKKEKRPLRAK